MLSVPQSINPLHLAKSKERIEGSIRLDSFKRLEGDLLENSGKLDYSLSFDFDEAGICVIESKIDTQIILECQRCLKPVMIEIHKNSFLGLIGSKNEMDSLAKKYEPLQLNESTISVKELIEDELLLATPLSPRHVEEECAGTEILDRINADKKQRPFAALATLKKIGASLAQ